MTNICCLLDACTVINLIHIDEDDFLLKKISKLDLHINELVFNEVRQNVYVRLKESRNTKYSNRDETERNTKLIEQKLTFFRGKKNDNIELLKKLGENYFEKIREITNYTKRDNGELYSTAFALYLSRYGSKKIFFYTDDYPAKDYFMDFFDYQQIGHIKDSVDLLVLLYWLDDSFTQKQLDNLLGDLFSQYATEVTLLKEKLNEYYRLKIDAKYLKGNRELVQKLQQLIFKLEKYEFCGINDLKSFFSNKNSKCSEINKIIENYSSIFELENNFGKNSLLSKITLTREKLETFKIQKKENLCS